MKKIVIGIGNPNFKDDGVGLKVVEELKGLVDAIHLLNVDFKVIDFLLNREKAVIVDGIKSGAKPGSIIEIDPFKTWNNIYSSGPHSFNIFEILKVGYEVFPKEMPKEIKIIGIEVQDVNTLERDCSPLVKKAIPEVIKKIKKYLEIPDHF